MSELAKRLLESVKRDLVVNGDSWERDACARQMIEAAKELNDFTERLTNITRELECTREIKDAAMRENAALTARLAEAEKLLREACEAARAPDDDPEIWHGNEITDEWFDRAQAALEGKP